MRTAPYNLIWIDLEMTGLDTDHDKIIEIATIVTDSELNIIAEGPVFAIHQNDDLLMGMDDWNKSHHNNSGLLERVKKSSLNEAYAEDETLKFLAEHTPPGKSPMCGNSICQDRRFLHRSMPRLEQYFHYRNLDVSSIKILAQEWAPSIAAGFNKSSQHLALQDIRDSIEELRYYRQHFFNIPGPF